MSYRRVLATLFAATAVMLAVAIPSSAATDFCVLVSAGVANCVELPLDDATHGQLIDATDSLCAGGRREIDGVAAVCDTATAPFEEQLRYVVVYPVPLAVGSYKSFSRSANGSCQRGYGIGALINVITVSDHPAC
jgi:hypothetical protein